MGKDQSYPVLFQGIEDRIRQVGFGAKFNVVPGILWDLAEEFVQILGQFCRGNPVILDMVFLLEDDSIEAWAEDLYGGLVELLGENIRIQVVFILNEGRAPPQLPGDYHLRGLEKNQILFLHLLAIAFEDMEIRGRASL